MVILESISNDPTPRKLPPPVLVTGTFVDIFSEATSSCRAFEHASVFYSILPSNKVSKICFASPVAKSLKLYLSGGHNATKILLAIFYDEPRSFRVFVKGKYISPALSSSNPSSANAITGTNYFNFQENLLYVAVRQEDPVEIHAQNALHIAFTIAETSGAEVQAMLIQHLADFLQIGHSQVQIVHNSTGSESTLKVIADHTTKQKRQCSTMKSCMFTNRRAGQEKTLIHPMGSSQPSLPGTSLRVLILEISDPPSFPSDHLTSSFSSKRLNGLAESLVNALQVGRLQQGLRVPVDTLVVTVSTSSTPAERNSSRETQSCLYVKPYNLSVWIQPSGGVVGRPLPRQPQVVFLDKQGWRVQTLGFTSRSWIVTAHLQGDPDATLKGTTREEVQDGRAAFHNLIISSSCLNCYLIFKVTSPPGATLSVKSSFFTVHPVAVTEKSAIVFTAALGSAASAVVLGSVVLCWLKKNKRNKKKLTKQTLKTRKFSQIQMNNQKSHTNSHRFGKENKHDISAKREDLKRPEQVQNAAQPLKKLHQQTLSDASAKGASDYRSRGGKSIWSTLELQQLGFNEPKVTNQHGYCQQKEIKGRPVADERYKRHSEKPAPRSGGGTRGKLELTVM